MSDEILDLLQRRTDLSTFLVHFTRGANGDARKNLLAMLGDRRIEARTALGMGTGWDSKLVDTPATQRVVCFSETPIEHAWMMVRDIADRQHALGPYGVVFTKTTCRRGKCNPVWYLDITKGYTWLTNDVNTLVAQAVKRCTNSQGTVDGTELSKEPIFRLTPFMEQMGKPGVHRKEFWWEREWRHAGDFTFHPRQVVAVLAPEADHSNLRGEIDVLGGKWTSRDVPLLDPTWGLERMIAALSRIDESEVGPWPE